MNHNSIVRGRCGIEEVCYSQVRGGIASTRGHGSSIVESPLVQPPKAGQHLDSIRVSVGLWKIVWPIVACTSVSHASIEAQYPILITSVLINPSPKSLYPVSLFRPNVSLRVESSLGRSFQNGNFRSGPGWPLRKSTAGFATIHFSH